MRVKFVIATAAIVIIAGPSFAQSLYGDMPDASYKSTLSRSQVVEELRKAQVDGEIVSGEMYGSAMPAFASRTPRADVVADLKTAQRSGEILNGELYQQQPSMLATTHTRMEIRGEAIEFAKAHHGYGMSAVYGGN